MGYNLSMLFKIDTINSFILFIVFINSLYGSIIYSKNSSNKINFSFFILTITISLWCITMFAYRGFFDHDLVLWMARLLYFTAITIPTAFIYFAIIFPYPDTKLNNYHKYLIPVPMIILCLFSLFPDLFIQDVILYQDKENSIVFNQRAHVLFGLYVICYFIWAYLIIFKKYLRAEGILKTQFGYIFIGTLGSTTITLVTNLAFLFFGYFDFNWVGQVGIIFMITLIFYSIVKFELFNIKLIAIELITFAIWIIILIRIVHSQNLHGMLTESGLLIITIIFGVLLIRNVLLVTKQREQIEKLTNELEQIYSSKHIESL